MSGLRKDKMSNLTFKALLLSAILNGVFISTQLQWFLLKKEVNRVMVIPDVDSEIHTSDLDEVSGLDSEMDFNQVKLIKPSLRYYES